MLFTRARRVWHTMVPLGVLLLAVLVGCGGSAAAGAAGPGPAMGGIVMAGAGMGGPAMPGVESPIRTTDADWQGVAQALGRAGKVTDNSVYRVSLPRTDLHVVSLGVPIKPGLSFGGYATFTRYRDGTMLMGDMTVTEAELTKVTDVLQAHGIDQTALHKHLLEQTPPVWWAHFHAMGDPVQLAEGFKAALDATAIPPAAAPAAPQPPVDLDTAGIDQALGRKGTADGGLYKFTIARRDTLTDAGRQLPPATGVTTGINFQPTGGGKAAINGDFVMTAPEVQKVIQALRKGGIDLVEVHNHSLTDDPHLFYAHFWAVDDGVALAKTLRVAVDATNVTPGP